LWLPSLDYRQSQTGHRGEIFEGLSKERKEHKKQTQRYGCRAICERTERGIRKNSKISRHRHSSRPHRTLRNSVVHPKDKVKDEKNTALIHRVPCNWGDKQEVRSEDQEAQERSGLFHSWCIDASFQSNGK